MQSNTQWDDLSNHDKIEYFFHKFLQGFIAGTFSGVERPSLYKATRAMAKTALWQASLSIPALEALRPETKQVIALGLDTAAHIGFSFTGTPSEEPYLLLADTQALIAEKAFSAIARRCFPADHKLLPLIEPQLVLSQKRSLTILPSTCLYYAGAIAGYYLGSSRVNPYLEKSATYCENKLRLPLRGSQKNLAPSLASVELVGK